ncbi:MAG: hypothetical protein K0R12_1263 [Gammaproteobacteria bacterium]|jgi:hypothetical protein|nr:hypothetical protein [Gammaproteobacteria bacterium]
MALQDPLKPKATIWKKPTSKGMSAGSDQDLIRQKT